MLYHEKIKKFFQKNIFNIIIIILFLFFVFLLHWNSFNTPWERDEGEYAYSAWLMQQGEVPYINSFIQKPPLIIYTYYFSQLIRPFVLWPPRLLGFIFTLASCFLLSLIAKKNYGSGAGWLALWISPLLLSSAPLLDLAANTEKFMLLPLIGLLALFTFKNKKEKRSTYFWAGILSALAVLYKPIALPPVALIISYWLIQNWRTNKKIKQILNAIFYIVIGALLIASLCLFYFIINGAASEIWKQVVTYNMSYAYYMKKYFPNYFLSFIYFFWKSWWPIILIVLASMFFHSRFLLLWWVLLIISLLSIINVNVGHYYLLIMPFLILITAGTYAKLSSYINLEKTRRQNILLVSIIILIICVSFNAVSKQFTLSPDELSVFIYGHYNSFHDSELMAEKIKQNTKVNDQIFIVGSEPQIYYFSQRKAVSKFNITYPLAINTPWQLDYQKQVIDDISKNEPVAIILSLKPMNDLWNDPLTPRLFSNYLENKLKNNYRLIGGTSLDAMNKTIWIEPNDSNNKKNESLLLYLRK